MNHFAKLVNVEDPDSYVPFALSKANKRIGQLSVKGTSLERLQKKEVERLVMVRDQLSIYVSRIHDSWPSIDALPEFYLQLLEHTLSIDELKHALGALGFAKNTIQRLTNDHIKLIKASESVPQIKKYVAAYLGRVSSIFKKIAKKLIYLEEARLKTRKFPAIDPSLFTVAIAGFPNVGKSTLLKRLTGANPEIQNYSFTTKGLNTGYFEHRFSKVQLIDTPGVLGREKENEIEYYATITRRYVARLVVYVFDLTEPYPLCDQELLYETVLSEDKDLLIYVSKADLLSEEEIALFKKKYPYIITDAWLLREQIEKKHKAWK